ncbi:MAG: redoxin domain-containing protein [Chloroflexi bacterium]|nr:MAG: redoxin domain-containing protein [Chloroflexota bacterium]
MRILPCCRYRNGTRYAAKPVREQAISAPAVGSRARLAAWSVGGLTVGAALAVLGWGVTHPPLAAPSGVVGRPAPPLTIQAFDGSRIAVADFRGRPVVLNFWASWCVPCRQEAPVLAAAARSTPGVEFVGAGIQDREGPARAFQQQFQEPYPVGLDAEAGYLRYGVTGPPETYFIDGAGRVRYRFLGPLDAGTLRAYLDRIGG